jgi:uncharacterized membrane protein
MEGMETIGLILVVLAIPLMLGWVPPNRFYVLRVPATLNNPSVWKDVHRVHGRHLLVLGLLMVGLEFILPLSIRTAVLTTIGVIGLVSIVAVDWRLANRLRREREAHQ